MFEVEVKQFDLFFAENYDLMHQKVNYLFRKQLTSEEIAETVHDLYLRVKQRIQASGYTGSNFMGYCFLSLRNVMRQYENEKKVESKKPKDLDFDDLNYQNFIESHIQEQEHDTQPFHNRNEFLVRCLFRYLDQHYSPQHANLYRMYYLSLEGRRSYNKLSASTGLSRYTVKNIISKIKVDVQKNFIPWVKLNHSTVGTG